MLFSSASYLVFLFIFYFYLEMGLHGLALATGLSYLARFIFSLIIIHVNSDLPKFDDVKLFSFESCTNVMPLL